MLIGIDEAGRGPVVGPLVVCALRVDEAGARALAALAPRDSKAYGAGPRARAARSALARRLREIAQVELEVAAAEEVDRWASAGGLNRLEQALATRLLRRLARPTTTIVADGARLFGPLQRQWPLLRALDRADQSHPVVAAASIVAKVERDERLGALLAALPGALPGESAGDEAGGDDRHPAGGGYPNAATARWLRAHVARHQALPPGLRRSWSWPVLVELLEQLQPAATPAAGVRRGAPVAQGAPPAQGAG
ncbi:MAG: hypothetical protein IPL40_06935 [Proteobacteria bacterium]|nr:hypothetical protein [Pseudomonadota bacterium]